MIRLMLVDDHEVVRIGLASLFATVPGIEVVAQASNGEEAIACAKRTCPDVVLMYVRMPDSGDGVAAARVIASNLPHTRVVMLTSYSDDQAVMASIMAGAAGYLLKQTDPEHLIEAVKKVAAGASLLDPEVTAVALEYIRHGHLQTEVAAGLPLPEPVLSEQERKVLELIASGMTNRQIARELNVSPHTVKARVSKVLAKLRIGRRSQAAVYLKMASS